MKAATMVVKGIENVESSVAVQLSEELKRKSERKERERLIRESQKKLENRRRYV